ncbi:unnamed protein product [Calicophoron daubneyi]|uniref:UBP-type domain-containing protein n=1 Tax=Calicophoron daubneyi TaxID=300641 RepID=A0AAV2TQH5_CALDB
MTSSPLGQDVCVFPPFQALVDTRGCFAVTPLISCPHLLCVKNDPEWRPDFNAACNQCEQKDEVWICLSCYTTGCGRYANGHMLEHFQDTNHPITLSMADLSFWCYLCESYIDSDILWDIKQVAHKAKFGVDLPGEDSSLSIAPPEVQ